MVERVGENEKTKCCGVAVVWQAISNQQNKISAELSATHPVTRTPLSQHVIGIYSDANGWQDRSTLESVRCKKFQA